MSEVPTVVTRVDSKDKMSAETKDDLRVVILSRFPRAGRFTHQSLSQAPLHFSPTSTAYYFTMFYIIGLGLCDEKDITVRGLEARHPQSTLRPSTQL
jgi:hypothetical protein